jgi:predicted DNA-binding protein (UPF0251 family)
MISCAEKAQIMRPSEFEQLLAALQLELRPSEAARRLGISRTHYHRIRTGETRRLSHDLVTRVEVLARSLEKPTRKA